MDELIPGVWHWTALHPRIGQQVHSHWLADARVVLDPMVPPECMPVFDPAAERVVLTNRHHLRRARGPPPPPPPCGGGGGSPTSSAACPSSAPRRVCTSSARTTRPSGPTA